MGFRNYQAWLCILLISSLPVLEVYSCCGGCGSSSSSSSLESLLLPLLLAALAGGLLGAPVAAADAPSFDALANDNTKALDLLLFNNHTYALKLKESQRNFDDWRADAYQVATTPPPTNPPQVAISRSALLSALSNTRYNTNTYTNTRYRYGRK